MFSPFHHITSDHSPGFAEKKTASKSFFQPKLSVNQPNDVFEQEAESIADKVMRTKEPSDSLFFAPAIPSVQRKCEHCEEEKKLQRKATSSAAPEVTGQLENYIGNLGNSGMSLSPETRHFFEPKMGYDFSKVKIHTYPVAAKSADSINALAYTSGNNIIFNQGQYAPGTASGDRLLAHELTHVIQQNNYIQRQTKSCQPGEISHENAINILPRGKFNGDFDENQRYGISNSYEGQVRSMSVLMKENGICVNDNYIFLDLRFLDSMCCMHDENGVSGQPPEIGVYVNYHEYGNFVGSQFSGYNETPYREFYFESGSCPDAVIKPNFLTLLQIPVSKGGEMEVYIQMYQPDTDQMVVYSDIVHIVVCPTQKDCTYKALNTGRWLIVPDDENRYIHDINDGYHDGSYYEIMRDTVSNGQFICNDQGGRLNVDNYKWDPLTKTDLENA